MSDKPVLRRGDKGPDVIELQNLMGLTRIAAIGVGFFGPETEAAVKAFQKVHDLPETGVCDGETWAIIEGEA